MINPVTKFIQIITLLCIAIPAFAGNVRVTWENNVTQAFEWTRIDYWQCEGTFQAYWGVWPTETEVVLPLAPGNWCFSVNHITATFEKIPALSWCAEELVTALPRPMPPSEVM